MKDLFKIKHNNLVSLSLFSIGGLCLGLGHFLAVGWLFSLIGLFVFFLAISRSFSFKSVVLGSCLTWFINLGFATSIFWSIYPIEWIDLGLGKYELLLIGLKWLITTTLLSSGGIVFGILFWLSTKTKFINLGYVLAPLLWLLAEISQSFIYSIFVIGDGVGPNIANSVGYLGYQISTHPTLLTFAKIGGVYSLSFLAVTIVVLFWFIYQKNNLKNFYISVALAICFLLVSSTVSTTSNYTPATNLKIAIIETEFGGRDYYGEEDMWEYRTERVNEAVSVALNEKPDFILLPEDARFTKNTSDPSFDFKSFRFFNAGAGSILIDTARTVSSPSQAYARAFIYDLKGNNLFLTDKQYLTPLGEYLPNLYGGALHLFGLENELKKLNENLSYVPGPLSNQTDFPSYLPRILFCFEALDPSGVRKILNGVEAPFIAHPISHAWFHNSKLLEEHLDRMLKTQAVWNNIDIVISANMAESFLYTKNGQKVTPETISVGDRWKLKLMEL